MRLSELRSLGAVSEERLIEVGIRTPEDLAVAGAVGAYLRLKRKYPRTSVSWLYALHCAVLDLPWEMMTEEMRRGWKDEVERIEAGMTQEEG